MAAEIEGYQKCFLCFENTSSSGCETNFTNFTVLTNLLRLPKFENNQATHQTIYCSSCSEIFVQLNSMLEEIDRLERSILNVKREFGLKLKESWRKSKDCEISTRTTHPVDNLRSEIVMELRRRTILSTLLKLNTKTKTSALSQVNEEILERTKQPSIFPTLTATGTDVANQSPNYAGDPYSVSLPIKQSRASLKAKSHAPRGRRPESSLKRNQYVPSIGSSAMDLTSNFVLNVGDRCDDLSNIIIPVSDFFSDHSNNNSSLDSAEIQNYNGVQAIVKMEAVESEVSTSELINNIVVETSRCSIPSQEAPSPFFSVQEFQDPNFSQFQPEMTTSTLDDGTQPFICNICGVAFTSYDILQNHQVLHHPEQNNKEKSGRGKPRLHQSNPTCQECGKTFAYAHSLKDHMLKQHQGVSNFYCDLCGFGVLRISHLRAHMASRHCKERNFKCTFCSASYKNQRVLNVHLRKHTGEKPYECDYCPEKFVDSTFLRRHERAEHAAIMMEMQGEPRRTLFGRQ